MAQLERDEPTRQLRTLANDAAELWSPSLGHVLLAVASAVRDCACVLREPSGAILPSASPLHRTPSTNAFGDTQHSLDLRTDAIFWEALRATGQLAQGSSEEASEPQSLGGSEYCAAWDPLDGSSVVDAGFAVGSIVGIWHGAELLGRCGADQEAACYAVYGPRTSLVVAARCITDGAVRVHEYALGGECWQRTRTDVRLTGEADALPPRFVAPSNARACADNPPYKRLLHSWLDQRLTIRYSGACVPDVHHVLTKGSGVFCCPSSPSTPSKLRLLFEAAPMAFIVEAAGGASMDGTGSSLLLQKIMSAEQRTAVCMGSSTQVEACREAMCFDSQAPA